MGIVKQRSYWALFLLLVLAAWLRWRYVQTISLYVDEFTTLWAARRVQALGLPLMPSGVLYTRGLLASYVEAGFLTLFGFSYTVGRLPSLLFGLATLGAIFAMGRRLWQPAVGWLAAIGLALLPEAIVWSGRARFYAQLQFFVLLMVWAGFMLVADDRPAGQSRTAPQHSVRRAVIFVFLFILALFSQEETILLYPPLLLATLLWRGWRALRQPRWWIPHLLCLLAMGGRYALEIFGQPGYFETIQSDRPYIGLIFDLRGAWQTYAPLLVAPGRIAWTISGLIAVAVALVALARHHNRLERLARFDQATLFFGLHFGFVLGVVCLLVGTSWRETRYLFLVQPFWLLIGAAGAWWFTQQVALFLRPNLATRHSSLVTPILLPLVGALLVIPLWPAAQGVFAQQVEGYDRALAYLATQRQVQDAVLSPQPPACALALGEPCDYYAVQRGYEEFVIPRAGVPVDRWTGAPLLNTTDRLQLVLKTKPRTWLVTDSFRLATRYEADFVRTVIEQFDLAFAERGVMVLQANGWRSQPSYTISKTLTMPLPFAPLALTGWQRTAATPGQPLHLLLFWQGTAPIHQQYNTSIKISARDGQPIVQADSPPARGLIPTNLFFATPVPDLKVLNLPANLPAGRYRIDVVAYAVDSVTPLGSPQPVDWFTVGPPPSAPPLARSARWRNGLQLVGMDTLPTTIHPGDQLNLRLVWTTDQPVDQNYTIFVHLVGTDGKPLAQADRAPEGGFYPTSGWDVGERIADSYPLTIPSTATTGKYDLRVGLYRPETNERLPLMAGGDMFSLAQLTIEKP